MRLKSCNMNNHQLLRYHSIYEPVPKGWKIASNIGSHHCEYNVIYRTGDEEKKGGFWKEFIRATFSIP